MNNSTYTLHIQKLSAGLYTTDVFDFAEISEYLNGTAYLSVVRNSTISKVTDTTMLAFPAFSRIEVACFDNVIDIETGAFCQCSALHQLDVPNCRRIFSSAFASSNGSGCWMLATVNANNILACGSHAFAGCKNIHNIALDKCLYVGDEAFYFCSGLRSADLRRCKYIGSSAFANCQALQTVIVQDIQSFSKAGIFASDTSLFSFYCLTSSVPTLISSAVFENTPLTAEQLSGETYMFGSLYVRQSLAESFKTATNWAFLSERVVGLPDAAVEELLNE